MSNKHLNGYVEENYDSGYFKPTCPFCGRQELPSAEYSSQEKANEAAAMRCNCNAAIDWRIEKQKKEQREDNIKKIKEALTRFRTFCTNREVEISESLNEFLFNMGVKVLDDECGRGIVNFRGVKITFSKNTKGNIVVSYTRTEGLKVEV